MNAVDNERWKPCNCGCLGGTLTAEEYITILRKVGFKDIDVKPVLIYAKSVIKNTFLKDRYLGDVVDDIAPDIIDGAFAGHI